MLPFFYADLRMVPAGVRAIGSALVDSGFSKTRIVLQQWNHNFLPSQMRLDGRLPDLFLISSMSLHTAACKEMIRDIGRVEPSRRPLVIAGGSLCIYEPWEVFECNLGSSLTRSRGLAQSMSMNASKNPAAADVAVTGEEYILLNLLETLLSGRAGEEPLRQTFLRARDSGALDAIPGLVYPRTDPAGNVLSLVNTGVQRLVGNLDELPMPTAGYGILEPPSRRETLASRPLEAGQVRKHSRISSLAITFGCKFSCEYCPIPAYNQRRLRGKSGARVREEISLLHNQYGLRYFFGTDDNFFANQERSLEILESLATAQTNGVALRKVIRWGTEVTVHDTLGMREHLSLAHRAGVRALWLGVEDMTGALVRKGQTTDKTLEVFQLLRRQGICPMPMMMHHESQPLVSRGAKGLLNQVSLLRRSGAVSLQVLMLTPSAGSRSYDRTFESGLVYRSAAGRPVQPHMYDGNYVIACGQGRPWRKQFNIMAAYIFFYNPLRLIADLIRSRGRAGFKPAGMQIIGMAGLVYTIRRTLGWALRLMLGKIERYSAPPGSPFPMQCGTGILPVSGTGILPVSGTGILPVSSMGILPMSSTGVPPVSESNEEQQRRKDQQ
jgi:radical SAM superfamily enzyme YgiQ (UPF0313 family)